MQPDTTTATPAPAPSAAPSTAADQPSGSASDASPGGPPSLASLAARAAARSDAQTGSGAASELPVTEDEATNQGDDPGIADAAPEPSAQGESSDEVPTEPADASADLVRSVVDAVLAQMDERLRPLHERLDAMARGTQGAQRPARGAKPRAQQAQARAAQAPVTVAQDAAPAQPTTTAATDQSRRQRALDDPYFAQAMLRLGGESLPDFILDDAAVHLQNRSYYATRLADEVEGPKAREQIARIDRNLARLEYEARRYEREQAAMRPDESDAGEDAEPAQEQAATLSLDARAQYGRRIAAAMRRGDADVAFLSHLSPEAVIALAVETEADEPDAFFDALVEAAEKSRPAPAPQAQGRGRQPAAPARQAAVSTQAAQAAAAPAPQNGALRVRNPAPVGAGSEGATVGPRWPTDRPPTLNEVSSRVNARPN